MRRISIVLSLLLLFLLTSIYIVHAKENLLHGLVYFDRNNDGKYDDNDTTLKDVYVKIYKDGERLRDVNTSEAINSVTDEKGIFKFEGVSDFPYEIRVRKPFEVESLIYEGKAYKDNELSIIVDKPKDIIIGTVGEESAVIQNDSKGLFGDLELRPVYTTLKTAVVGIIFTFIIGLLLVRLSRSIKIKPIKILMDVIFTLPLVLPPTVIGFFLLRIFGINSPVGKFFLDVFDFRVVFSWESTVIAAVVLSLPLMYRSTMGALEQVDENLVYAARTLGFTERKIFWKILIPNAIPGIASATILAFARGMGEYGATSMIAGNILGQTRTLPIAVAVTTAAGQDDQANAYVLIILVMSFILISLMNIITYRISTRRTK